MMRLFTLGTSAGTEPYPAHHHTSLALQTENGVYFFDAGECCGYTAHLCGLDLLDTRAVFLTHPHMDHVGGLGNLLWYVRKMTYVRKMPHRSGNIDLFTPCRATVEGFMTVLRHTEGDFACAHTHTVYDVHDGRLFDNGDIAVTAVHTHHLPARDGVPQSFAYRVEKDGKMLVFTGDMRLEDLDAIVPTHCDVLLAETGHHRIEDICAEIRRTGKHVGRLLFVHHGGYIMRDPEAAQRNADAAFDGEAVITRDGDCIEI